jgi:hypothetical protein
MACCRETGCQRKKPFKIRRGGLTRRVFLITDYGFQNEGRTLVSRRRHDITDEIEAFMRSEGWVPPPKRDDDGED